MNGERKVIPVVFSTNDKYALYCYLAIYSLLKHADKNNYYDIRVFMVSLSQENIQFLEQLKNEYASVTCMNVLSYVKDADLRELSFFSVETFYRLFISQILAEYKKVVYLDSDMLVLHDITPLYDTDMNGHPIAAVHDVVCAYLADHARELGLEMRNMFNAGVLVIDTEAYERQNIREAGLEALAADYRNERRKFIYVDQDVLNTTVYNDVEFIDDRWNFQWEFTWRLDGIYDGYREKYEQTSKDPWIIHYAGDRKPWVYPSLPFADYFWDMVLETGITKKVVENSIRIERENKERLSCFQGFRFPYERVKPESRVAVYGAGNVGQDFVKQLDNTLYARLVLWVDMRYEEKPEDWNVEHPEQLAAHGEEFDHVIIAIDDEKIASQAAEYLRQLGIPKDKLIWQNFRRCDYE
ncbi:MAG: glycosyltransferase family 8 protein [Lachnospiraceae bacterium]|nr:glycosyltransferase family 8 protein [Lachnospiraceae bacterium]